MVIYLNWNVQFYKNKKNWTKNKKSRQVCFIHEKQTA